MSTFHRSYLRLATVVGALLAVGVTSAAYASTTGSAGPPQLAVANGAVAYAHVLYDGTIDTANSKNVSIPAAALPAAAQGFYCLHTSVPVHNVMATPEYNSTDDHSTSLVVPQIETQGRDVNITGCSSGDTVIVTDSVSLLQNVPHEFQVSFN